MTDDQKNALIGKMIDCPESLSPDEMKAIASDPELRDIYMVSAELAGAYGPTPDCDAEAGWRQLMPRLQRRRRKAWAFKAAAAAVAAVALAVAVGLVMMRSPESEPQVAQSVQEERQEHKADTIAVAAKAEVPVLIADAPARQTSKKVKAKARARHEVRECAVDSVVLDELMRVEMARVDNCEAMAMAEVYICDYHAMKDMHDEGVESDDEFLININILTTP